MAGLPAVGVVLGRQVKAYAAGVPGASEPFTPLVPSPLEAAFVEVVNAHLQWSIALARDSR